MGIDGSDGYAVINFIVVSLSGGIFLEVIWCSYLLRSCLPVA